MNGTSTAERPGAVERRLPPHPASVSAARSLVRDLLLEAGRPELVETAALLVSEVVTNALLHAGTPIDVSAWLDDSGLRVEVGDGSQHLPVRRRYATTAGTGRGMMMLEEMVDDWGVSRHRRGKTVWFYLTSPGRNDQRVELQDTQQPRRTAGETTSVELVDMPLLLHVAWQEHAEALLREYLLASLDDESGINAIQMHAEATDAIALLEEQVPRIDVTMEPDQLMKDATEPFVTLPAVTIDIPVTSLAHFQTLREAIEASIELARTGRILTPPTQPELRLFREWLCDEVLEQPSGRAPRPWSVDTSLTAVAQRAAEWDIAAVEQATTGLIAADEADQIIAISGPALALLGYDAADELVGERLLAIIPDRFRQAHVAGFTMFFLVGRQPLLGRPVEVPALCRDGAERMVRLMIHAERVGEGRTVFLADISAVEGPA
ncbi:MAG: ATP-binding protein [Nocardioides sp.]